MRQPIFERAAAYMADQTLGFGKLKYEVHVGHQDGSTMVFTHAYAEKWVYEHAAADVPEDEAIMHEHALLLVYTEHNGDHVFSMDDLSWARMLTPVEIPQVEGKP